MAALLMGSSGAWAYAWPAGATIKAATNGVPVIAGAVSRTASVATSGGAAALRASQLLGVGSASAALTLSRGVGLSNLALVARIAAGALGPVALGGLALTGVMWAADHWAVPSDPYPYPSGTTANRNFYQDGFSGQACDALADHCSFSDVVSFWLAKEGAIYGGTWSFFSESRTGTCSTVGQCNHTITIKSGATTHTRLIYSNGSDGPSAGTGAPATDAELENAITTALEAQPTLSGSVLDAALAHAPAEAALLPDPQTVSGPATVDGGSKSSVKVDATGTTTTTINTTYNFNYAGDVVTITQTDVETVNKPDNSTTTTTNTTGAPAGTAPPPPKDPPDVCKEHPNASGCSEFGEKEAETQFPEQQRSLSWVPSLSAVGACPAPETATVHGQSISISWQPVCDLASGLRPVVLAVAWLSAGAFVFGVGRKVAA